MQYRREIEGLRALAVMPVVLFHAWMPGLPGGFAGVDVFFVISGYLITRTILDDRALHRFTLRHFYERRARRILPALFPVLLVSLLLAWATMIPPDFRKFAQSMVASAMFMANMLLARKTGYFDDDEGFAPLLHLWTLSVEEQFYIVFPLMMLALLKLGRWFPGQSARIMPAAFTVLAVASFAAGLLVRASDPALAFFALPTRAWELLAGAVCVVLPAARRRGWAALTGVAMILAGYALIDPATTPGWALLLPVGGAILVLRYATPEDLAGRLLSLAPLTAIGGASYGIYLWHNPLLATLDYVWLGEPPLWIVGATITLAVVLGFASLHLVERPVRNGRLLRSPIALVLGCAAMLALVLMLGLAGHWRKLEPLSAPLSIALGNHAPPEERVWQIIPPGTGPLPYIVYGDSFARQYFPALTERYGGGALLTSPGCLGLPGLTNFRDRSDMAHDCASRPARLARIVRERKIGTVIWAQRWEREMFDAITLQNLGRSSEQGRSSKQGWAAAAQGIERMQAALPAGTRLIIIANAPTAAAAGDAMEGGYLRCLAYINITCPASYRRELAEGHRINPLLAAEAARLPDTRYFDPSQVLCDARGCALMRQGKAIYHDWTHLSEWGAEAVVKRFTEEIPVL